MNNDNSEKETGKVSVIKRKAGKGQSERNKMKINNSQKGNN